MFCKECNYNLFGATASKCPECGTPFDNDDPGTFSKRPSYFKAKVVKRIVCSIALLVSLPIAVVFYITLAYHVTNSSFERVRVDMSKTDADSNIGLIFYSSEVTWNQVEPVYRVPSLSGKIIKYEFWPYHFYVVYENDSVVLSIPAHE